MAKRLVTASLILPLFMAFSAGVSAAEDRLYFSLKDGAVKILEGNLDITIQKISPKIAEEGIRSKLGAFDTSLFGEFKREDADTPLSARSSIAAGGLTKTESKTYSFDAGITGKIPFGTEYTIETTSGWTKETFNNFEYEYETFTGLTLTQPLLKNFGKDANEVEVSLAKKDRDISVYQLKSLIIETVADFGESYWDLVQAREVLNVRTESLDLAEELLSINRRKLDAGAISALEVTLAEAAAATRKDEGIAARKSVKDAENAIKILITSDVYSLKDKELVPALETPFKEPSEGVDESITKAVAIRPDYLETKSTIEKSRIQVKYAENQKYPEVDLEASYGYNGIGSTLSDSYSASNPQWAVGISFKYPLENRAAAGGLAAARLEADQNLLKLKKIEQSIILSIDNALKDISSGKARVEAARISTALTRESLVAEEKKLAAGRSTTFNVLKVQEDLAKARLNEISAVVEFNKALIRYYKEKGTLLEELSINLEASSGS